MALWVTRLRMELDQFWMVVYLIFALFPTNISMTPEWRDSCEYMGAVHPST